MSKPSYGGEFEKGYQECRTCGTLRPEQVFKGAPVSDSEYEEFVLSVWKKFDDPGREMLVVGLGVAGEAGEYADVVLSGLGVAAHCGAFADLVKKAETYSKPMDLEKATKELGDIEYYLGVARRRLGLTRDEVLRANMEKLKARHPSGFNVDAEKVKAVE